MRSFFSKPESATRLALWAIIGLSSTGCATAPEETRFLMKDASLLQDRADFYWPYAALAANIYHSKGISNNEAELALGSAWLRKEVQDHERVDPDVRKRYTEFAEKNSDVRIKFQRGKEHAFESQIADKCPGQRTSKLSISQINAAVAEQSCATTQKGAQPDDSGARRPTVKSGDFIDHPPTGIEHCRISSGHVPLVPLEKVAELGWKEAPEFHKTFTKGWRFFIPELAIDVWRRPRESPDDNPTVEYAIVYRGTAGGGGWFSNLRAISAGIPIFWDQYRQAAQATQQIVNQINLLHTISDEAIVRRERKTRLLITGVGHSLGAGLATYSFIKVPAVTRVIGFNPSPFDGSSLISIDQRVRVMTRGRSEPASGCRECMGGDLPGKEGGVIDEGERQAALAARREVEVDSRFPSGSILFIYEKGEAVSTLIRPCLGGPLWGDEGGPNVVCEEVNISPNRMDPLRQHNMAQLACGLYVKSSEIAGR